MPGAIYDILAMFDRILSLVLGAAIAAGGSTVASCYRPTIDSSAPPATAEQRARGERYVDSIVASQHLPSLAVTISSGRNVVWRYAKGWADVERRIPATTTTQYRIGSVSKLLTATALARLAQTGRLDLDERVSRYVAVPPVLGAVTLRQLAGHLGGVRHYRGNEFLSNTHYDSLAEAIGVFINDSLVARPGTRYTYSSYGYTLLGVIIERATQRRFLDAARRHVLDPLDLYATVPDIKGAKIPERATLYTVNGEKLASVPDDDLSGRWPSGGYLSTTDDLSRFGRGMLAKGLLDLATLEIVFTPQRLESGAPTNVGIGWRIGTDSSGRRYYHHGGSSNGGSAFLLVYPREQLVVAMASNAFGQWSEREALAIARVFLR